MKEGDEIVLIEDNEDNAQDIIANLKENYSVRVLHFEDGKAALDYLLSDESAFTKLILLDLVLPSVDGIEIFKRIKADPAKKHIPIVMLISSVEGKDYVDSLGIHPDGFANKPFRLRNSA
jgi:CheY-like chemotaxis protein